MSLDSTNRDHDEDKHLKQVLKGGADMAAMRRIKKLENKVEELGKTVQDLFRKYDEQIKDLMNI